MPSRSGVPRSAALQRHAYPLTFYPDPIETEDFTGGHNVSFKS